ncbi:ABC transporter permease [Ferruginibacter sp. SUN106]|uniref:ABC transporter permease n=1 Tax=Ferruginibacter sp. SUN106 TaxID=2978348 RepID=UPI003D36B437
MLKNYFKLVFKNLRKQKMFSLINILGLTVGITCCLMIFLFVKHEFSFDDFHKNGDSIYRLARVSETNKDGVKRHIAWVSGPYAAALRNDYPDAIQKTVRVMPDNDLFSYNNISFNEKKVYIADSNFFQFFDFPLLKGDMASVLNNPGSIVLTATAAKKYFGNEDPLGKTIEMNKKLQLKVTGIAADIPSNSNLDFDIVVPISNFKYYDSVQGFPNNGLYTYVQLNPHTDAKQLESQFPQFMNKYLGKYYAESGFKMGLSLDPMKKIYLNDQSLDGIKHGSKKNVYIFMGIGLLILTIACINFMNLATARAADRSKEVGLRKVMGAVRKQLIIQFIIESVLYAAVASAAALLLTQLLMPAYNNLLGYKLSSFWADPNVYFFIFVTILVIGLLAGTYPALLLSSFSPIESLKGKLRVGKKSVFFRKALVVFQFSVSVLLIIGITVIASQMNYVRSKDLGFNKEQSMLVRIDNTDIYKSKAVFKNMLATDPSIVNVSLMSGEPGGFHDRYGFEAEAKPGEKLLFNTEFADFEFVQSLGLKIIAGRELSSQFITDSTQSVLINRAAATNLGYTPEQAIGKWIKNLSRDSVRRTIVGVVEDYHFTSLKDRIEPIVISTDKDWRVAVIRLKPGNQLKGTISNINKAYASVAPGYPFEYNFLDEEFNQHYKDDIKQGNILSAFSVIAIFIACLGLFGLASYTAIKRTKEIGVRKVLGSSVQNIVVLLSKDLLKPVLLGTCIAIPVGYYFMSKWLEGFAYRIGIQWWMFAIAAMAAILIALFTVSFQAIKAAIANPVKSLRTE